MATILEKGPAERSAKEWEAFPLEVLRMTAQGLNLPSTGQRRALANRLVRYYQENSEQPVSSSLAVGFPIPHSSSATITGPYLPSSCPSNRNYQPVPTMSSSSSTPIPSTGLSNSPLPPSTNDNAPLQSLLRSMIQQELSSHVREPQHPTTSTSPDPIQPPFIVSPAPPTQASSSQSYPSQYLPPMPGKQIDQIRQSLFDVDFALLLPSPSPTEDSYSFEVLEAGDSVHRPTVSVIPKKAGRAKVDDQQSWLRAWNNFLRTAVYYHPHLAPQLLFYQSRMCFYFTQYQFSAVYAYDRMFRSRITHSNRFSNALSPLPFLRWDMLDDELFNTHLRNAPRPGTSTTSSSSPLQTPMVCYHCGETGHIRPRCPHRQQQPDTPVFTNRQNDQPFRAPQRFCSFFNNGNSCTNRACQHAHRCRICQGNHPGSSCHNRFQRN